MSGPEQQLYEFGPFRLNAREQMLLRGGEPISLTPKVFDTLLVLVRHSGRLLEKEELMQEIWPGQFVEEINLTVNISALRKVLGESQNQQRFIETIPKRGYRFIAPVRELPADEADLLLIKRTRASISIEEEELEEEERRHGDAETGRHRESTSLTVSSPRALIDSVSSLFSASTRLRVRASALLQRRFWSVQLPSSHICDARGQRWKLRRFTQSPCFRSTV